MFRSKKSPHTFGIELFSYKENITSKKQDSLLSLMMSSVLMIIGIRFFLFYCIGIKFRGLFSQRSFNISRGFNFVDDEDIQLHVFFY